MHQAFKFMLAIAQFTRLATPLPATSLADTVRIGKRVQISKQLEPLTLVFLFATTSPGLAPVNLLVSHEAAGHGLTEQVGGQEALISEGFSPGSRVSTVQEVSTTSILLAKGSLPFRCEVAGSLENLTLNCIQMAIKYKNLTIIIQFKKK